MRMFALHQYLPVSAIRRVDTKRLNGELRAIGYCLDSISGVPAAGNRRLWLCGPEGSTSRDNDAINLLLAQATRSRVAL